MKPIKMLAAFLALALLFPSIAVGTAANASLGSQITLSPAGNVKTGDSVTVTVSLTGYTAEFFSANPINGIQVDITEVNPNVLTVVDNSWTSLIPKDNAFANTPSYQASKSLVRLLYYNMGGTLAAPQEGLLEVTFKVREDLTESGSITLPVKIDIVTANDPITLTDSFTIAYEADSGGETPVTSVDVSWGAMSFTYTDGTWNPESHQYEGGGWSDGGTGYVTVKNTGTAAVTASFTYTTERRDISGSFINDGNSAVSSIVLPTNATQTVHLVLDGTPTESLADTTIGTVTVTIGGE